MPDPTNPNSQEQRSDKLDPKMKIGYSPTAMVEKKDSRRQCLALQAVNPDDRKLTAEVQISFERMQTVGKRSMGQAKECALIVPMILQEPTAIFEGLTQDSDEDRRGYGWRCYCGIPVASYHADGSVGRPYPGQVYLVFVNEDWVAYNWRWEKSDPDDPGLPIGHKARFRKKLL